MAHYHPAYPYFTISVCERGILQEPYRLVDVGVRGGLQSHWLFLGDHLEAWGFDPLYEEGVGPLIAANPHPERIRYFNFGLGDWDGERAFRFLPENPSSSFFAKAADNTEELGGTWQMVTMRRLDSLVADGTLGPIDFMKLDAESYEVEIVRGGKQFFTSSGIFGLESEVSFTRTTRNPRSHFVDLYEELALFGFTVWDAGVQRAPQVTLARGYPKDLGRSQYAARPIGRQVIQDMLFLSPIFDEAITQDAVSVDVDGLLKMIATTELYGLQDVGLEILFANKDALGRRLDVEEAADWLVRERVATTLTYRQYRSNAIMWVDLPTREPTDVCYKAEGATTCVIPLEPGAATSEDGAAILRVSHPAQSGCGSLRFNAVLNCSSTNVNTAVLAVNQDGKRMPVAIIAEPLKPGEITVLNKEFVVPIERHDPAPIFDIRVGLASPGGTLFLNPKPSGNAGALPPSYIRICDEQ
jgi:FkbM family methyltransferase